jgi:non-ribosomal peptide synthetase component F
MRREFENVVGFFANTIVLRFKINSDMGFSEFAISVKHTIKELFDNQDIPFEYVVNEIAPIRNPLYSPVFQHVFTMRSFSTESDVKGCISMEELENYNTDAKFDFVFILSQSESSGDISVSAEYDNALFSESEIIELLQNYKIAANAVISSPDEPIGTVSLTQENVTELNSNCDEEMYDF